MMSQITRKGLEERQNKKHSRLCVGKLRRYAYDHHQELHYTILTKTRVYYFLSNQNYIDTLCSLPPHFS